MHYNKKKIYTGKSLPKARELAEIGDELLDPAGRNCIKYELKASNREPKKNIYYLARHKDVMDIMKERYTDHVDLSQFDEGLASGIGEERFFLGAESEQKVKQWEILKAALSVKPEITRQNASDFKRMAETATLKVLDEVRQRHERNGGWRWLISKFSKEPNSVEFNAVKEFGYVVPFLVMAQFIGLQIPERATWGLRLFTAIRNLIRPGTLKLKAGTIPASHQSFMWVLFIFGHLFANIGSRNRILKYLSLNASKKFRNQIDFSYQAEDLQYGCLLYRLKVAKEEHFQDIPEAEYLRYVRGIVLELAGAGQILTGTSFAKILKVLNDHNVSIDDFVAAIETSKEGIFDEALRMDTTTQMVFRVVKNTINIGGETIPPGSLICLLIDQACKDKNAFDEPDIFSNLLEGSPRRESKNYLTFGPHEGISPNIFQPSNNTHPCFGQYWARSILRAMFEGLQKMPEIEFKNSNKPIFKNFAGLPDTGLLVFRKPIPEKPQTLVTICSEIIIPNQETVRSLLEGLGNPATEELKKELNKIDTLHFVSMHIIEGIGAEPHYLMLEMSGDGSESKIIDDICGNEYFREKLLAIYQSAGVSIDNKRELERHLVGDSVELKRSLWPRFFSGRWANGLGFSGTSGLTLKRIRAEHIIAERARELLNDSDESASLRGSPHRLLKCIRQDILIDSTKDEIKNSRWVLQNSKPPQFAETRDSAWNRTWGRVEEAIRLFPLSFIILLVVIGAVLWSAIWEVLFSNGISKCELGIKLSKITDKEITGKEITCEDINHIKDITIEFPPNLSHFFNTGNTHINKEVVYYLSAMPQLFNCILAFVFTLLISIISGIKLRNNKPLMFKQTGVMVWFLMCYIILQFQTVFHNLTYKGLRKIGFESVGLETSSKIRSLNLASPKSDLINGDGLTYVLYVLITGFIVSAGLYLHKIAIGKKTIIRGGAPYFVFFLIFILFGITGIQQLALYGLPSSLPPPSGGMKIHTLETSVLNKFDNAKLSVMLLYPLVTSIILMGFTYIFNVNYVEKKWKYLKRPAHYFLAGAGLFSFIFYTSFFSAPADFTLFLKNFSITAIMLWVIPAIIAVIVCVTIFKFTSSLSGKKRDKTALFHVLTWFFAISAAFNLTSQPRDIVTEIIAKNIFDIENLNIVPFREKMAEIIFALGFSLPVLLLIGVLIIIFLWKLLSKSEANNKPHDSDAMISNIEKMMLNENNPDSVQNHMLSVTRLIPEHFRHSVTLPLALSIMVTATKKQRARPGFLGTIGTVHYARWIRLPRTNNYVFASNYDGSFESYLEDFITKFGIPLNGAWSHGIGYPKTKNVFYEGSEDGERFIRWARGSMRPSPFWYSAYPKLTVEQIRRNALIRDGLARIESPSDAEAWLDLFDSVTRPDHALQTEQIQSLVFGGAKNLKYGCCLVVERMPNQDPKSDRTYQDISFNRWLRDVRQNITFGDLAPQDAISYLALSKDGLNYAGFSKDLDPDRPWKGDEELEGEHKPVKFSSAFALGMNNRSRASMLGDLGNNEAQKWDWGKEENPTLAVILVYAKNKTMLNRLIKEHKTKLSATGMRSKQIKFTDPEKPEPFGFKDGISNPILKGTRKAARNSKSIHLVSPGEFVLGYKDNRGYFPSSPQIESARDQDDILPAIPKSLPQKYPKFMEGTQDKLRDLGRNGTYLVVRQLEQNVDAFNEVTGKIAKEIFPSEFKENIKSRRVRAILATQAKLMGRWQDGRPLVTSPVKLVRGSNGEQQLISSDSYGEDINIKESEIRDNEFLYGRDDPQGHACPFGSHIRRTFPRDSLNPGEETELDISNRHRILRRGRSYEETKPDGKKTKGTFFICLNANIQRQFEFVQQTWVGGSTFHGIRDEVDPITAQRSGSNQSFTFQAPGRDIQTNSLQSFVTMKGGGYFFMPGRDALEFIAKYVA